MESLALKVTRAEYRRVIPLLPDKTGELTVREAKKRVDRRIF